MASDPTKDFDLAPLVQLFWQGRREEARGDVGRFMLWFEEEARRDPERMAGWVVSHERALIGMSPLLTDRLCQVERIFERRWWENGEWETCCQTRSFFEWLGSMAPAGLAAVLERDVDLEELEGWMRARGESEGGLTDDEIPAGMPSSHWWWWTPGAPPRT
jgi:hypothetical protein